MRLIKPVNYETVTQAIAKGSCPICVLLKNAQSEQLQQMNSIETGLLCNFHTWALAAGKNGAQVATLFLQLLETRRYHKGPGVCGVCEKLKQEERVRIGELGRQMLQPRLKEWMQKQGTLCIRHATQLGKVASPSLRSEIEELRDRNAAELKTELEHLRDQLNRGAHAGAGGLGRAAEFLVAQRGMEFPEDKC